VEPRRSRRRPADSLRRRHHLQQLLRAGPRQVRPCGARRIPQAPPVDHRRRGRGEEATEPRSRHDPRVVQAGGARVPHALRRGVVDGDPLAGLPSRRPDQAPGADIPREIRRLHHALRRRAAPRPALDGARLALRRGPAHRRGHAPARAARRRPLRQGAARAERGAHPARRAVEVWLQGHQVDREDPLHRARAADDVEPGCEARVRLLREREPGGGPPALEPGDGAAHRRGEAAADAAVQRLRGRGGGALRGHGPQTVLLMKGAKPILFPAGPLPWLVPAVVTGGVVPAVAIALGAYRGKLGANPVAEALNELGLLALVLIVASLACTPLKELSGWTWPIRVRKTLGLLGFFYAC